MEQNISIDWPFAGLSENFGFGDQEPGTAREYQNVRGIDPRTGRIRGAQRSGVSKYMPAYLKGQNIKVQDLISFFQDNRQVSYTAIASGSETVTWSTTTPSKKDCLNVKTDRQGNVYALDGNSGIVKLSADNAVVWQLTLPITDPNHIVRALFVDEFDRVYAAVSAGGVQDKAMLWAYDQLEDNKFELFWAINTKRYVEDIETYGDKLYTIQNDSNRKRSFVTSYDGIDTTDPVVALEWRVPYPANDLAIKKDGSVIVGCEAATGQTSSIAATNFWRDADPSYQGYDVDSVDWTPYQLTNFNSRVWSWYVADDIDITDVASDFANGVEILRWRDRTKNHRHFFADLANLDRGPVLSFDGLVGHKSVSWNKTGVTQPNQVLRTSPNASTTKEYADQQRTMIPAYTDSQFCVFIVMRPSATQPAGDNLMRTVWYQDRNNVSDNERHILIINATSGDAPSTAAGNVSWYTGPNGTAHSIPRGGRGGNFQPKAYSVTPTANGAGACLVVQMYDGGFYPGTDFGGFIVIDHCQFRVNGNPGDIFDGATHKSLEPTYLGAGRKFGTTDLPAGFSPYLGDILEILVLDRGSRNEPVGGAVSAIVGNDHLEDNAAPQSQLEGEMTRIEGYLMHKYGIQSRLPNSGATYPHPFGRTGASPDYLAGPPANDASGVSTAQALANKSFACVIKYTSEGKIVWCANEMATGDGSRPGGFGYAVAINSSGNIYSVGPKPTGAAGGSQQIRMIVDKGTTFSLAAGDGAWSVTLAGSAEFDYHFPRLDVDEFDNLYLPYYEITGGPVASFRVYSKTGTLLHSKLLSASQQGHAVAVDRRIPAYRNDLATKRAEHMIVATTNAGTNTNATVHKVRLVSVAQTGASPRALTTVGVSGGTIKRFSTSGTQSITGGTNALDSNSYVQSVSLFKRCYWTDGRQYKQFEPITNAVIDYKSTQAGAIPSRCALIDTWRGRIVLARSADEPHNWFLSRKDDPDNWDFFPPVPSEIDAVAGNNSPAGLCPDIINAIVPYSEDILVFGGDHSIWALVGDPAAGGRLELISDVTGMSFGRPWCKDPNGVLYFFGSQGGLFRWVPGARPERVSLNKIERQLQDVNLATHYIRLAWNYRDEGLHIFQFPFGTGGTQVSHWFYEMKTDAFAKDLFGTSTVTNVQPTAVMVIDGDDFDDRVMLLGCEDGRIRKWDREAKSDDTRSDDTTPVAIDAYVTIGPLQGDFEERFAMETQFSGLTVILSDRDDGAKFELFAAESPESIGLLLRSGPLVPGRNPPKWDRVVGPYCWLRIRNAAQEQRFSFERAYLRASPAGPARPRNYA